MKPEYQLFMAAFTYLYTVDKSLPCFQAISPPTPIPPTCTHTKSNEGKEPVVSLHLSYLHDVIRMQRYTYQAPWHEAYVDLYFSIIVTFIVGK